MSLCLASLRSTPPAATFVPFVSRFACAPQEIWTYGMLINASSCRFISVGICIYIICNENLLLLVLWGSSGSCTLTNWWGFFL